MALRKQMESRWIRWRDRTVAVVAKRSQFAYAWVRLHERMVGNWKQSMPNSNFARTPTLRVHGLRRSGCGVGTKYSGDPSAFCLGSCRNCCVTRQSEWHSIPVAGGLDKEA